MKHIIPIGRIAKALLALGDAKHGVLLQAYDIQQDRWHHRWFADDRMVVFSLNHEDMGKSLDDLDSLLKPVIERWRAADLDEGAEDQYERLKRNAELSGIRWAEERMGAV